MSSITIHRTSNIDIVQKLHEEIFPGDEWYDSSGSVLWLALDRTRPIGFCCGVDCRINSGNWEFFLSRAGVLPAYRGQGLQKRMIRIRENCAKRLELPTCVTYCVHGNWASLTNLIVCGYRVYEPASNWAGTGCIYLQKTLF